MGNTTTVRDTTWYLKWIATVILIVGTAINSAGFHPEGPIMLFVGGLIWLVVSIRWKEASLIVTNAVMALAAVGGFLYSYLQ